MSNYFNASGTIGFTCDSCGREMQGCTWVNGMKFCAKCYQETFGNTNPFEKELRDKIADLEAKLEQYEKFMKDNEWDSIEEMQKTLNECEKKYFDMQQQLAKLKEESDDYVMSAIETNVDLKNRLTQAQKERELDNAFWKQECDSLQKALAEKEREIETLKTKLEEANHERHEEWKTGKEWKWEWQRTNRLLEEANQAKTDLAIAQLEKVKEFNRQQVFSSKPLENFIDQQINKLKDNK